MKTITVLTVSAMLLSGITMSNAQSTTTDESSNADSMSTSFGVKGGVNFATVQGSDVGNTDSRTSFHLGVVGELPISEMFSVQGEVMYSGQGFDYDFEGVDGQNVEYQLDYLNIPVLAKIYLFKGFSVEAGPQFGFKVNEEIDYDPADNPGDTDLDEAESFDFSLAGGLTFQTEMGLFASGRYNYGLTEIIKDADIRNSVFQISLGYKF